MRCYFREQNTSSLSLSTGSNSIEHHIPGDILMALQTGIVLLIGHCIDTWYACKANGIGNKLGAWRYSDLLVLLYMYIDQLHIMFAS